MTARIFSPSKTAMQSGRAKTGHWVLEFERETPRRIEPLMGYTSSSDMKSQIRLDFDSLEEAVAYAEREGLEYHVEPAPPARKARRVMSYAENFSYSRKAPWTH
ncbi:MAG: ETC complex I subunit [Nitratireductor sp.]|nr:ETC complex I subunit [Nitratireductor sp.]